MKSVLAALCLAAVISSSSVEAKKKKPWVSAETFTMVGTITGDIILGGCKAIVALPDPNSDTITDTCLISCKDVKLYVTGTLFNAAAYTEEEITPSQFLDYSNTFSAYSNAAIN